MIYYKIGDKECEIDWKQFLCIETKNNKKIYKSDFKDKSSFYEYIDKNITKISTILFDGCKYILENGVLHNLFGPAHIIYRDKEE